MPQIVTVNASITVGPIPSTLQQTGAMVSQGGTNLTPGTFSLLTSQSSLAQFIVTANPITSITWSAGVATVTTVNPHGFPTGLQQLMIITGAAPGAYNGTFLATSTGASTFTYPLLPNPGTSPATTPGAYEPESALELTQMNNTFWAQGSTTSVYVLELGAGTAAAGVTMLSAFISNNNDPQFFYSYLVPRYWDTEPTFHNLVATFEDPSAKTYFFTTTTLGTYKAWQTTSGGLTVMPKSLIALVETPALGVWPSNVVTELLSAPAAPVTGTAVSGALPGATYFVRTTYNTAFGETVASTETSQVVPANSVLTVTSPASLSGAVTWNVYVGTAAGAEVLQASALALASPWQEPNSGLIAGVAYPTTGYAVATTTTNHGVAVGQWFQLVGFTPAAYNNWYQALGGTATTSLVFKIYSDIAPESVLGSLAANMSTQNAAPGGNTGEFTLAAAFQHALSYNPNSANLITPFAFSYLFGVTPWATQGNGSLLTLLKNAFVNYVLTGAEGGITNTILDWGTTGDGEDFIWWFSADWIQIQMEIAVANAIINGSNNPQAPLYYSQFGINSLQDVIVGVCKNGVSFGLGNGTVTQSALTGIALAQQIESGAFDGDINVNAVPFVPYLKGSPGDYKIGKYAGFSVLWIPMRGFTQIIINLNLSDIPIA